jgi:hypothetical protein
MTPKIPPRLVEAQSAAWDRLAAAGDWWTGAERLAFAGEARAAFGQRHIPPWQRSVPAGIMTKLAADASQIDRAWANESIDEVGEGAYVELVAIAASVAVLDSFAEALDINVSPLPKAQAGEPSRAEPDGVGGAGAYVRMTTPWTDANVARALTLSPSGNALYRGIALPFYHEGQFYELEWDRPISRPQAEVVATAVSAANECFY